MQNAGDANKSSTALLGSKSEGKKSSVAGSPLGPKSGPARLDPLDSGDLAEPASIAAFAGPAPAGESSEVGMLLDQCQMSKIFAKKKLAAFLPGLDQMQACLH